MQYQEKRLGQIFFIAATALTIALPAMVFSTQTDDVAAQEPAGRPTPVVTINAEMLEVFGLSSNSIVAAAGPFDLEVNKTANVGTITSGGNVTYTITVKNNGPNAAPVVFQEHYPSQMSNISYTLSVPATPNLSTPPTMWLFNNNLLSGETAFITITGKLQGEIGTIAKNTAEVIAFDGETNTGNNSDEVNVTITGGGSGSTILYLPIIAKAPPRILIVSDNFSSSSSGWTSADDSNCERGYSDNQYRMKANNDKTCFTPAPSKINNITAEYAYAEYQVSAQVSSGSGNFYYGLYMNGAGDGNNYQFRIKPDSNCGWTLIRRKTTGSTTTNTTLGSGSCSSSGINTNSPWNNTFAIRHDKNGLISLFINDKANNNTNPVFTINDGNQLTGWGVGLFVDADDTKDITVRFDNFEVYTVAQ